MILEWNILHRVDSLISLRVYTQFLSHSRAVMALDHIRLGVENKFLQNKSGRIFLRSTSLLYKIVATNLLYFLYITSEVKQCYEALYLSYKPRKECKISQLFKTNCTHSIFRTNNRGLFAKPFKKFPKSPSIRPAGSHFWQAPNLQQCER